MCLVETSHDRIFYMNGLACSSIGEMILWLSSSEADKNFEVHLLREIYYAAEDDSDGFCRVVDLSFEGVDVVGDMSDFDVRIMIVNEVQLDRLFDISRIFKGRVPLLWRDCSEHDLERLLVDHG